MHEGDDTSESPVNMLKKHKALLGEQRSQSRTVAKNARHPRE